jgi:cell wall-associated NlpC family hydrolase
MSLRETIATTAIAWEGTPFKHQGRVKAGIDCIGLVVEVCRELGLKAPDGSLLVDHDVQGYAREPAKGLLQSYLDKLFFPMQGDEYQLGDVLLFTFVKYPQHCGIVTRCGDGFALFTHASEPAGKVITSRMDVRWGKLLVGRYRFSDVVQGG